MKHANSVELDGGDGVASILVNENHIG